MMTNGSRTALVTGGASGLGMVISRHLARTGIRVIAVGRSESSIAAAKEVFAAESLDGRVERCDVTSEESVEELASRLADEDISVLVNNAGVPGPVAPLVETSLDDWKSVMETNVYGVFLVCRAFLPAMVRAGDGDVITIASVSGKRPLENRTPYCASKMAVLGLSATLASEVGPHGVRVNTLSPGPVRGPRMDRNFRLEAERSGISPQQAELDFVSRSAMKRMVEDDEVGAAVVAMLTMTGLSGADIDLSAGMVAR